nr:hypothetical protein [Tanacetum cinerariifolium]
MRRVIKKINSGLLAQLGLLNAVQELFPQAEHRLCARHIYANWYSDFHGEQLKMAFYSVAKASVSPVTALISMLYDNLPSGDEDMRWTRGDSYERALKGVVKGMLLTAVGKDPNNQMFPLAWAIVETESQSSWTWFLKHLKIDIKTIDGQEWTFMSDKQKGLLNAVQELFPQAEHRLCARHIYANWYSDFRGEQLKMAFYSVAKCANEARMNQRLEEIDDIQSGAKKSIESKVDAATSNDASAAGRKRKKPLRKTTLKPTNKSP